MPKAALAFIIGFIALIAVSLIASERTLAHGCHDQVQEDERGAHNHAGCEYETRWETKRRLPLPPEAVQGERRLERGDRAPPFRSYGYIGGSFDDGAAEDRFGPQDYDVEISGFNIAVGRIFLDRARDRGGRFRGELGFSYGAGSITALDATVPDSAGGVFRGDLDFADMDSYHFQLSGFYDIRDLLYIGLGVGVGEVGADITPTAVSILGGRADISDETYYRILVMLGVLIPLGERFALDLGYQYSYSSVDGGDFLDEFETNGFRGHLVFYF